MLTLSGCSTQSLVCLSHRPSDAPDGTELLPPVCCRLLADLKAEDWETPDELERQLTRLKREFQQLYSGMLQAQDQGPQQAAAWEREQVRLGGRQGMQGHKNTSRPHWKSARATHIDCKLHTLRQQACELYVLRKPRAVC